VPTIKETNSMFRKFALFGVTLSLGIAGLSGCSSDSSDTTAVAVETGAPAAEPEAPAAVETAAPEAVETAASVETSAAAPAETTPAAAASTGGAAYTLKEWSLEGSATLPAGPTEIAITNGGNFAHEFVVIKDTTYEDAPKNDLGTVLEDKLPAGAVLGEVEKIEKGASAKLSVDLAPGKYLFVCNIEFGPNSHAGKGQRLNVTVA
jgi:uncharacterized cupredoxin-like copper-binding protein